MRVLLCTLMLVALAGAGGAYAAEPAKGRAAEPRKDKQEPGKAPDGGSDKSKEKAKQKRPRYQET